MALGRANWLFAGSLRAGQRAAAVMSLIQSAKLNGHDPYAYLKDVFTRSADPACESHHGTAPASLAAAIHSLSTCVARLSITHIFSYQ